MTPTEAAREYINLQGASWFEQFEGSHDESLLELVSEWLSFDQKTAGLDRQAVMGEIFEEVGALGDPVEDEWPDF